MICRCRMITTQQILGYLVCRFAKYIDYLNCVLGRIIATFLFVHAVILMSNREVKELDPYQHKIQWLR